MKIKRHLSLFLIFVGVLHLLAAASCFTSLPWKLLRWLQSAPASAAFAPETIVVLGGGGIPAESTLSRCYVAAEMAARHPQARVVIAIPSSGSSPQSPEAMMRHELELRGVDGTRIMAETKGRNTWEQSVQVAALLKPEDLHRPVMVVTSDYHMRRSRACLRQAGFTRVEGRFATDSSVNADLGAGQAFRYTFWSAAEVLVVSLRELVALTWYQLRGWI